MPSNYPSSFYDDQYAPPAYDELFQARSLSNAEFNMSYPKPAFGPGPNDVDYQQPPPTPSIFSYQDRPETGTSTHPYPQSNQSSCYCLVKLKYLKKILLDPTNRVEIRHRNYLFFWAAMLVATAIIVIAIYGKLF
jgi:hypothetical protein